MSNIADSYNVTFCQVCNPSNILDPAKSSQVEDLLGTISRELATDRKLRQRMGAEEPSIWTPLRDSWSALANAQLGDNGERIHGLRLNLAKFTRNLAAEVPLNQRKAYEIEPDLRRLLHLYTSYYALQEDRSSAIARMLGQALCNIVTGNEELLSRLWKTYIELREEENVLIRLLGSRRPDVVVPGEVLVLNCILGRRDRASMLRTTPLGLRISVVLLDQLREVSDSQPEESSPVFDIGSVASIPPEFGLIKLLCFRYSIFKNLIECGEMPPLYASLTVQDEIVTPHQTTLLKLLDAYLQSSTGVQSVWLHRHLTPLLLSTFSALSDYTQNAVRKALGPTTGIASASEASVSRYAAPVSPTSSEHGHQESFRLAQQTPLQELDLLLPKVSEALVLVSQCLITVTLAASTSSNYPNDDRNNILTQAREPATIKTLIETLRLLDLFLPRINFGAPAVSPSTSQVAHDPQSPGFKYVKRDLVRLLGILSHESRAVQDTVRTSGGIPVVMNMCVIDERNPFLREHAILCMRNLLRGNPENQAVVNEIQPLAMPDQYGPIDS
ncbi:hypothetical protein GLOTRDRAFT_138184 [Gloeophyllum trabeum ATCC 11539]|uniref:Ataxin-10 homolog n=1 Tax=Gloeophyllum trabeum (strain ATCC 11539 / FP-39264 / Madison 617) TaxID=670483 RepID=S7QAP0_GLOTA|nr:uncharacterized protein GLOTRDRAFT_138184 [Gloeophyllum trabeum ATCC 11539]EPQ56458.1 hypothetical protein GLOTRDRAFT_138184 [Gloeophyllum trabeum ATCC 11539]